MKEKPNIDSSGDGGGGGSFLGSDDQMNFEGFTYVNENRVSRMFTAEQIAEHLKRAQEESNK